MESEKKPLQYGSHEVHTQNGIKALLFNCCIIREYEAGRFFSQDDMYFFCTVYLCRATIYYAFALISRVFTKYVSRKFCVWRNYMAVCTLRVHSSIALTHSLHFKFHGFVHGSGFLFFGVNLEDFSLPANYLAEVWRFYTPARLVGVLFSPTVAVCPPNGA